MTDFARHASNYDSELARSANRFGYSAGSALVPKIEALREIWRRNGSRPRPRVLDFGCGPGRLTELFQGHFPEDVEYLGVDDSIEMIEVARRECPHFRFEHLREGLAPSGGAFDLIIASGVFHHIVPEHRVEILKSIRAVLAPGGSLLVWEHNPWNPVTRRVVRDCPFDGDAILIRASEMKSLLLSANFTSADISYRTFFPFAFRRFDSFFRWLPAGAQYSVEARA